MIQSDGIVKIPASDDIVKILSRFLTKVKGDNTVIVFKSRHNNSTEVTYNPGTENYTVTYFNDDGKPHTETRLWFIGVVRIKDHEHMITFVNTAYRF